MRVLQATAPLFAFWLVVTGTLAPTEVALGLAVSAAVGTLAAKYLWPQDPPMLTWRQAGRLLAYVGHLLRSVFVAAIQVAEVVLDPRMPIDPIVITHRTSFARDISRVTFANSITLTPGTITVDVVGDAFVIHCLSEEFADEIASGELERRVAHVFEE